MQNNVYDQIRGSLSSVRINRPAVVILELTGPILTKAFTVESEETRHFIRKNVKKYVKKNYGHRELRVDTNFLRLETERQYRAALDATLSTPPSTMATPGSTIAGYDSSRSSLGSSMATSNIHSQQGGLSTIASGIPRVSSNLPPLIVDEQHSHRKQISTTIDNILWRLDHGNPAEPLSSVTAFHLHMVIWGLKTGLFKAPVYPEIREVLNKWRNENVPVFIALGSENFIKLVLSNTTAGNLWKLFTGRLPVVAGAKEGGNHLVLNFKKSGRNVKSTAVFDSVHKPTALGLSPCSTSEDYYCHGITV